MTNCSFCRVTFSAAPCVIRMCRMSVVMGKTAASNETGEQLLVVVQDVDKPPVNTTKFFVYRQTPYIIDIFPLSHLLRYSQS